MDGRDQPDTNVVRIRRRGDPSEAERKRLARTIFAEEDDVGTFSRGNLVPPRSNPSIQSRDAARVEPDPYFEDLQRNSGVHGHRDAAAGTDSETTAYFEQLTNAAPDEMALMIDAPSAERTIPGSAQLPAEFARPVRGRTRKQPRPTAATTGGERSAPDGPVAADAANLTSLDRSSIQARRAGRKRSLHRATVGRLVRPATLLALGFALAGGAAFSAVVLRPEPPKPQTPAAQPSASSQPPVLAALETGFAAVRREAGATATAEHTATARNQARTRRAHQRRPSVRRAHRAATPTTHVILTADHTAAPATQTTSTTTTATDTAVTNGSSAEPEQPRLASSHAAAVNQPTTPAAGPSGLGRVVGSNCAPKCK